MNRNHHHGWFSHGFLGQKEPIRCIVITHSPHQGDPLRQGDLYTKRTPTPGRATGRNHKPKHPHNPNAMETRLINRKEVLQTGGEYLGAGPDNRRGHPERF